MDNITVKININDYPKDWKFEPNLWEMWIVGKLKEAGIPIRGQLLYCGLDSGTLHRLDDPEDFGSMSYIWCP